MIVLDAASENILVQKYGGSSMASPERIRKVAARVADARRQGHAVVVIVSAMGDTTDELIEQLNGLHPDPDLRELDQLMATGEIVSCSLMTTALKSLGVRAMSFNAMSLGIRTDSRFGAATIREIAGLPRLRQVLAEGMVAVIAGFQGIDDNGDLTTLGRGGSDITAVAMARALAQRVCEKYTDEDGVYTTDPQVVPTARKISTIDYDEMELLARFGAGILHPRAIDYARAAGIEVHVRSSFVAAHGSLVVHRPPARHGEVVGLTCDRKFVAMKVQGVPVLTRPTWNDSGNDILLPLSCEEQSADGRKDLIVAFRRADSYDVMTKIWQDAADLDAREVTTNGSVALVSVVGRGLPGRGHPVAELTRVLTERALPVLGVQQVGIRLSAVVPAACCDRAMALVHEHYFEGAS